MKTFLNYLNQLFFCIILTGFLLMPWSSDPVPGLLLLWGAGRHRSVAAGGPPHPPPHTRTEPQLRLEGDSSARMTSVWSKVKSNWAHCTPRETGNNPHQPPSPLGLFPQRLKKLPVWGRGAEYQPVNWLEAGFNKCPQSCFVVFILFFCTSLGAVSLGQRRRNKWEELSIKSSRITWQRCRPCLGKFCEISMWSER